MIQRVAIALALILAAVSLLVTVLFYTRMHDLSVQGCVRQNDLRIELNDVLRGFHQRPAFLLTDCERAWRLYGPEPPPQPYSQNPH